MSFSPPNGINVIWRLEITKHLNDFDNFIADINWPSSTLKFRFVFDNLDSLRLRIKRTDNCRELINLWGIVSVYSYADSIKPLNELNSYNFKHGDMFEFELNSVQNDVSSNGILTLLIQLWNSPEKQISVNYHVYSKVAREKCNFEWKLNTETEKIIYDVYDEEENLCHEFCKKIPKEFTEIEFTTKIKKEITIKLVIQNFLELNSIYLVKINPPIYCKCKLKFDAVGKNKNILNLMDSYIPSFKDCRSFDQKKIQKLIENKHLFYPEKYLILNVYVECIALLDAEITEVDYISDIQNIENLIESSNKFHKYFNEENSLFETLSTSLYALYKEGLFCDVTLCVEKEKFLCHKSVLCARSPVFRAMFDNDMQEKETNLVHVQNMDSYSFRIFLNTLYTDSLRGVEWKDTFKVYEAADKYDVIEIRKLCSEFFLSKLSKTNACQILALSYAHQDKDLMLKTRKFITWHAKEIMKLPDWNDFMARNPLFAAELMKEIITT